MINDFFSMSEEDELISQLKKYDEAYYLEGNNPLISDLEYDQFKDSVKSKYPNNPYFQEVGFSVKGAKVKHEFILGSLNKVKEDNFDKWLSKFNPNDEIIITPKYDGLTTYCSFNDNNIVLATTRGNGIEGTDITLKVKHYIKNYNNKGMLKIRGETLLPGDLYLEYNKSNRRNAASGILGRDELTNELKTLDVVFYELIDSDIMFDTEEERLLYINEVFPKNNLIYEKVKISQINAQYLIDLLNRYKTYFKEYCDLDGLVLTLNKSMRENEKYPELKVAFKHGDEEVIVEVDKVVWQTSRNGRVVPVVEFKNPAELDGALISRATAYNAKFILDNEIQSGVKVVICRSGNVIPKIKQVIH